MDMPDLLEALRKSGEVVLPFLMHEYWRDIGRPEEYALANKEYFEIFGNGN
jgi:NDP-sugar pyrophosphorylase family protein